MRGANERGFAFHYDPYNFDSNPELEFFQRLLQDVNVHPAEVEDVYFTGGLTDPSKTDFFVHYQGEDGRWHRYTPDFVIRKRPRPGAPAGSGRVLIVEVKSTQFESATREDERRFQLGEPPLTTEGRKAVALRKLEQINPDRLAYELVFARAGIVYNDLAEVRRFVREPERAYATDLATARALKDAILSADSAHVSTVILFGSRARGDARPDSDFDLLVLLHGVSPDEVRAFRLKLYRLFRGRDVIVEPWVMTVEEFEETKMVIGGLAHPAWTEGIPL
jgi:predicted nucleotidyltransferase